MNLWFSSGKMWPLYPFCRFVELRFGAHLGYKHQGLAVEHTSGVHGYLLKHSMSRMLWVRFFYCFEGVHREVALQRPLLAAP